MIAAVGVMWFLAGYVLGLATWQMVELWKDWRRPKG